MALAVLSISTSIILSMVVCASSRKLCDVWYILSIQIPAVIDGRTILRQQIFEYLFSSEETRSQVQTGRDQDNETGEKARSIPPASWWSRRPGFSSAEILRPPHPELSGTSYVYLCTAADVARHRWISGGNIFSFEYTYLPFMRRDTSHVVYIEASLAQEIFIRPSSRWILTSLTTRLSRET